MAIASFFQMVRRSLCQRLVASMSPNERSAFAEHLLSTEQLGLRVATAGVATAESLVGMDPHSLWSPNLHRNAPSPTMSEVSIEPVLTKKHEETHDVLGKMVADLGYKRVYVSSVERLRQLAVWEKNRAFKPHRAAAIGKDKIASGWRKQVLPGVITCFELVEPNAAIDAEIAGTEASSDDGMSTSKVEILDGQHRRGALMFMAEREAWPESSDNVLVEVFPIATETAAKQLFTEINKMEPVKLVDLPGEGEADVKLALSYAADALERKFPEMFKVSARCRPPHVHSDTLRDELFQSDILSRFELRTGEDLLAYLLNVNDKMSKRTDEEWRSVFRGKQTELDRALAKARSRGFFLGIDNAWMHR